MDESRQNLGLAMTFDPVKAQFSQLPDLHHTRLIGPGNLLMKNRHLIVFGGVSKDVEILDLGGGMVT